MPEHLAPPIWVATETALQFMLADISHQPQLAVDTESNSLHAYREQVCLIQFSTPQKDYLVDPLVLADLEPLGPIFANPRIEKIFHASEYDILCLRRDFGFSFANLFDTMQAARILGYQKVGLDALLAEHFGVEVNKRFQKADWGARPLTPELINYARFDTHYLIPLRDQLKAKLEEGGRMELAREDFRRACWPNGNHEEPAEPWERFANRRDLSLRQLTILRELVAAREQIASRLDRPPFKVMDDDHLVAITRCAPTRLAELREVGLSQRQVDRWGGEMLEAVTRGVDAPLVSRTKPKRPDEAMLSRLEKLKQWRKKVAKEMGVESDIILPRPYLNTLAERGGRDLSAILETSPWRLKQFGPQIKEVLGG